MLQELGGGGAATRLSSWDVIKVGHAMSLSCRMRRAKE